ncbi:MAG: alpha/beta hydrolase [Pseudomonadota bacterium]
MKDFRVLALLSLLAAGGLLPLGMASAADVELTGQFPPGFAKEFTVRSYPPPIEDGWSVSRHPEDRVFPIAGDGALHAAFSLAQPGFHRIQAGDAKAEVFLTPGAKIELKFPAAEKPQIRFAGDHADANQHLQDLEHAVATTQRNLIDQLAVVYSLDQDAFAREIEQRRTSLLGRHGEFLRRHPDLPAVIDRRAVADIEAAIATFRLYYPTVFNRFTGEQAPVAEDFYRQVLAELDPEPAQLSSRRLVIFLDTYATLESGGARKFENSDRPREKLRSRYQAIKAMATREEIRSYLLEQMFQTFNTNYGPADWAGVLSAFATDFPNHERLADITRLHQKEMAERSLPDDIRVYRTVDGIDLEAHLFFPPSRQAGQQQAAFLTFHGGGWAIGTPEWSYEAAQLRAAQGMVAISFEYRIADVHGSNIHDSMADTREAVRWVRDNAEALGIDPARVVAHGFSAGAHLAGITAIEAPEGSIYRPDALILHSSTYDTTKGGFFSAMTQGRPQSASLTHQVEAGLVPALLLHGKYDHLAPEAEFLGFVERMQALGNDFEYHLFEVGHFFRNAGVRAQVATITDRFLKERGFLAELRNQAPAD